MRDTLLRLDFPFRISRAVPNVDGRGYGLFVPDAGSQLWILEHWAEMPDETARQSLLAGNLSDTDWLTFLFKGIGTEKNPLIASTLVSYFPLPLQALEEVPRAVAEQKLFGLAASHPLASCRIQLLRMLMANQASGQVAGYFYDIWKNASEDLLNESDYTTLAYELSLRFPEKSAEILATQRGRITNPDRLRQFDFISRAVSPDTLACDSLFRSLLQAENRRIEPWAATALRYLNHPLRDSYAVKYIRPALEELQEVQRTGDIFFPKNWVAALLGGHRCEAAYREVEAFLQARPDYPPLLKNKILQAAYPLYRLHAGK